MAQNFLSDIKLGDNIEAQFGTTTGLYITHNPGQYGNGSFISNAVGNLYIRNSAQENDIIFSQKDDTGGIVEFFRVDGGSKEVVFTKKAKFSDNVEAVFGSGTDLKMWHGGVDSYIVNETGNLQFIQKADDKDIQFFSDDGSGGFTTYFYLDGSLADGTYNYTRWNDGGVITIGTDLDLRIWHDPSNSNSYVRNYGGHLFIENTANDKDIIFKSDDGSGGTATYFALDGGITRTVVYKNFNFQDDVKLEIGTGTDLEIYHDATNSIIRNDTGDLRFIQYVDDGKIRFYNDNGSGGTTEYFRVDGSAEETLFSKQIRVPDNVKIAAGGSSDLQIYHDTNHSYIQDAGTGELRLAANVFRVLNANASETMIYAEQDGKVQLRFNESTKFETTSAGATITGSITTNTGSGAAILGSHLDLGDNQKARFGASQDLQIYHNGSNSYIENDTGHFYIKNRADDGDIVFQSDDGGGGAAEYFRLDGGIVRTVFSKDTKHQDDVKAYFGDSYDLEIYHNGTHSYIDDTGTGKLILRGNTDVEIHKYSGEYMITATADGAVKLYYDDSKKLETTSAGVTVSGTTETTGIAITSTSPQIRFTETDTTPDFRIRQSAGSLRVQYASNGSTFSDYLAMGANNATFAQSVIINGDLTVNGTTTTINTATVEVEDNILQLNTTQGSPDTATAATSGISIYRGDGVTQASFIFDDADDTWDLTNNLNVAGDVAISSTMPKLTFTDLQQDDWRIMNDNGDFRFTNIDGSGHALVFAANNNATFAGTIATTGITVDSRLVIDNAKIYDNAANGNNKGFRIGGSGLIPVNGSGTDTTNTVDLGSSATRFKNLYLAGGASVTGAVTAGNVTSTSNSGDASIYINSTRPTLGFTDTNSFTDDNDIYIIRGTSGNKLQFQWYDDSAGSYTETFNIDSSGNATFVGQLRIEAEYPTILLTDTNHNDDWGIYNNNGKFLVYNQTDSVSSFQIDQSNNATFAGNIGIKESSIDANLHITDTNPNIKFERSGQGKWAFGMPNSQTYLAFDETSDDLSTPTMVLTKTTKRVGIGTASPEGKLMVQTTGADATPPIKINRERDGGRIQMQYNSAENGYGEIGQMYAGVGQTVIWIGANLNSFATGHSSVAVQDNSSHDSWFSMWDSYQDKFTVSRIDTSGTTSHPLIINSSGATFGGDVFTPGLYVNATSAVAGTQVAIVQDGNQNLQRWGSTSDGGSQHSYRFRIDQNYKFIGNSGSGDKITIHSNTGNINTSGSITTNANNTFKSAAGSGQGIELNLIGTNTSGFGSSHVVRSRIKTITDDSSNAYASKLEFYTNDASNNLDLALKLDSSQNATFAGDIKLADNKKIKGTTYSAGFISFESDGETRISANDDVVIGYAETLNIANNGVSTFAGEVTTEDLTIKNPSGNVGFTQIGTIHNHSGNSYVRGSIIFSRNKDDVTWSSANSEWTRGGGSSNDFSAILHTSNSVRFLSGPAIANTTTYTNTQFLNAFEYMRATTAGHVTFFNDVTSEGSITTTNTSAGAITLNGGTGVATTGAFVLRQNGDGAGNGIAITSSHATSHRIWKDANGNLNIGPSSDADAFKQDLSGNVTFAGSVDATNYKINGAQGSDGQVLTSTGSGVAWETPSTSSAFTGGTVANATTFQDNVTINSAFPRIYLIDNNNNSDYSIINGNGTLRFYDDTNSTDRLTISSSGNATFTGDITAEGGDITVKDTGTENAYFRAYATGTGDAGIYIDAVNGDGSGSDYFSLRQLDNKSIEFNARNGTGNTLFYSKGSLNLTQDGANSTFAGDITVNGGDLNLTKQNGSPYINMLYDGTNPGTNALLHYFNFRVDYDGTHQDWGGIEHRTNASAVRTDLRFNVKSSSGNVQTGLAIRGQASAAPLVGVGTSDPDAKVEIVGNGRTNSTTSLRVRSDDDQQLFYVRDDGVVAVTHNYFYVDNPNGMYSNGVVYARGGVSDDGGPLQLGGNSAVGNLTLTSNTSAAFAGNTTVAGYLGVDTIKSDSSNGVEFLTTGNAAQFIRTKAIQVSTSYGGTPPAQGILFGTDTNLYRDSSNVLKTDDSLIVAGDLTVQGTTVTIDTTNLNVEDKNITLNYGSGDTSSNADGAGITVQDGVNSSTDATIVWDKTNSQFTFSHGAKVNNDLLIGDQTSAASTQAFGAFDQLRFDNSHSSSNVGPNKIVMHDNGSTWIGGFGIHSDTVSYYTGGYHRFYKTTSQTASTLLFESGSTKTEFHNHLEVGGLRIVHNNDSGDQQTAWIRSNGNYIVINPVDGEHLYLNWDTGQSGGSGHVYVSGNIYASAFYDRNDTTYYVDPANTGTSVKVAGSVEHKGLSMTDGANVDQVKEFSMTFQLAANTWTDTNIDGTDLATGTYIMQVMVDDYGVGGNHYTEYYSATISWFSTNTNSTSVDEIIVHRAGHAPNAGDVQFRTQRTVNADSHDLMLQVKHNLSYTAALDGTTTGKKMIFKFRRLI